MEFTRVNSSHISAVLYDPSTGVLKVEFPNGRIYAYSNVTPEEFKALMSAPSVGSFFHRNIRTAKPYDEVDE